MSASVWPVLFAVFAWWFATGLVLLLDGLPRTTFRWSHLIASLLAIGALAGLSHTASQTSEAGAYCAFACALLLWGWHELSLLTGWVTGPRRVAVDAGASGWPRFRQALMAILWHELAILASVLLLLALTWGAPNQVGSGTFGVLWLMRISAKLNVFFGVRNLSTEWLPAHLSYLGSYFRRRRMNAFLPLAVAVASAVAWRLIVLANGHPTGSAQATGLLLVSTLLVLAIMEHALLVLPIQVTALWHWAMRAGHQGGATPQLRPALHAAPGPEPRLPIALSAGLPSPLPSPLPKAMAADADLLHAR
ncbi:MAG: putative photosynthetic complex assembly protein PuhE [Leptothrix sp. (in: b-proteobacteria)]